MNSGHSPAASQSAASARPAVSGGRFDFDDGGTYCGGWEDGKAHGHGVCTGPKSQGEYSGSWHYGFEVSGVYTWPSGSTYEGHWQNGRRHGLGVEGRGRWAYRGEWTQGFRGRYGVRQSTCSSAKYEGTWANGLQDGYGSETYADSGTYQGQWQRGFRHGYGVRTSAAFGIASVSKTKPLHASASSLRSDPQADLTAERDRRIDDTRGGFVLKARSDDLPQRRGSLGEKPTTLRKNILQGLRLRKQRSTGDLEKRGTAASVRSTASSASWMSMESTKSHMTNGTMHTDSNASFVVEDEQMDSNVNETYMGEWKNDRRVGYGVCERSDGLRYEGEWYNNKKYGYGVTTFRDGAREEGKYKNNLLVTSNKKKHLFLIRSAKFRERVEASVSAANRASKIALQKADIAISRTATARGKAEQADIAALHSREDSDIARIHAKQFAPDFHQPGSDSLKSRLEARGASADVTAPRVPKMREESAIHQRSRSMYVARAPSLDFPNGVPPGMENTLDDASMRLEEVLASVAPPSRRPSETMLQDFVNTDPGGYASVDGGDQSRSCVVNSYRTSVDREMRERTPTLASRGGARNSVSGGGSARHQAAMSDHFSQYRRPPSRDSSVDRFSGGRSSRQTPQPSTAELGARVRSPSRPPEGLPDVSTGAASTAPSSRPSSRRQVLSQMGQSTDKTSTAAPSPVAASNFFIPTTPEEAALMANSNMKRTESVFIAGPQGRRGGTPTLTATTLQRKKSLPDANTLPVKARVMPREEANHLAASRREDIRQQVAEAEMYRANPLLYLFNPRVKEWFSRQRLVMAVILLNVSLALLFIKLMT